MSHSWLSWPFEEGFLSLQRFPGVWRYASSFSSLLRRFFYPQGIFRVQFSFLPFPFQCFFHGKVFQFLAMFYWRYSRAIFSSESCFFEMFSKPNRWLCWNTFFLMSKLFRLKTSLSETFKNDRNFLPLKVLMNLETCSIEYAHQNLGIRVMEGKHSLLFYAKNLARNFLFRAHIFELIENLLKF